MPTLPLTPLRVSVAIESFNELLSPLEVLIEGEVASFSINRERYVFFDLKDETAEAKLGCFMWRQKLTVPLEDGMKVVVRGRPGIHPRSGQFRITVEQITPQGEGSLKRAYELLRSKLEAEGLFAPTRKRPLPHFPTTVGIVSSRQAAGLGDFMRIAGERMTGIRYVLADVAVQGVHAERELALAVDHLNTFVQPDVIVMLRGGGSLEDLQAFNSETVARAVVRSRAPVVVGVGHERDTTIADFCADVRAATPSNAAQIVIPDREEILAAVQLQCQTQAQRLTRQVASLRQWLALLLEKSGSRVTVTLSQLRQELQQRMERIESLAPQRVLARGYSITRGPGGRLVRTVKDVAPGDALRTILLSGEIHSRVDLP